MINLVMFLLNIYFQFQVFTVYQLMFNFNVNLCLIFVNLNFLFPPGAERRAHIRPRICMNRETSGTTVC